MVWDGSLGWSSWTAQSTQSCCVGQCWWGATGEVITVRLAKYLFTAPPPRQYRSNVPAWKLPCAEVVFTFERWKLRNCSAVAQIGAVTQRNVLKKPGPHSGISAEWKIRKHINWPAKVLKDQFTYKQQMVRFYFALSINSGKIYRSYVCTILF